MKTTAQKSGCVTACLCDSRGSNQLRPVVNDLLPISVIHCNLCWESYVLWLIIHGRLKKINQTIVHQQDLQLHWTLLYFWLNIL